MTLNQQAIAEIAAQLYWHQAQDHGVAATTSAIADTNGAAITRHPTAATILTSFGISTLPEDHRNQYLEAIAAQAHSFAEAERNMIGMVYLEDLPNGRSDTAASIKTDHLNHIPELTTTAPIERCGRLCLRHPLPAIVFSDTIPTQPFLIVQDTKTALGFDLPMVLTLDGQSQKHGDIYILTGIFQIPVPSLDIGHDWNAAIQNSTRFTERTTLVTESGTVTINARWPSPPS